MSYMKLMLFAGTLVIGIAAQAVTLSINSSAPEFTLTDTHGTSHNLSDFRGKYVVLEWINHGCPFVVKHYSSGNMQSLQKEWTEKGTVWLTICSSAEGQQGYMSNDEWNTTIQEKGAANTALLVDEDGTVGKLYNARTTPHMYVINPDGNLIYQGAIDDKKSTDVSDIASSENYVRSALTQAMEGKPVEKTQTQPYGCSVKYKN